MPVDLERKKATTRKRYAAHVAAGLCGPHGDPKPCARCKHNWREAVRKKRERWRAAGLCQKCGSETEGKALCPKHNAEHLARIYERRQGLLAMLAERDGAGCFYCGSIFAEQIGHAMPINGVKPSSRGAMILLTCGWPAGSVTAGRATGPSRSSWRSLARGQPRGQGRRHDGEGSHEAGGQERGAETSTLLAIAIGVATPLLGQWSLGDAAGEAAQGQYIAAGVAAAAVLLRASRGRCGASAGSAPLPTSRTPPSTAS